jgi:DNA-binding NtrC family response regulator
MSTHSVLVVDDEPDIRGLLQEILEDEGYAVSVADTAEAASNAVDEARPDLVLLDIWMPDTDGVSLLKSWKLGGKLQFPVIMISGHGTVETAVEAARYGAVDFIEKPVSLAKLLLTVDKALADGYAANEIARDSDSSKPSIKRLPLLLGDSEYVKGMREQLEIQGGRMGTLLLTGEPGSGRVLFAQNAHDINTQLNGAFIQLRCDTLSSANAHRELYGDELSGEKNGGVVSMGYLESAAGGTLFLTDVELLPVSAQQCLRQAIEQQGFTRVGGDVRVPFRCRLMASSRVDLSLPVKQGSLDPTLARLLSAETLVLKALRDHPEDIPALLEGFVNWHVEEEGLAYRHFTVAAQNRLRNLDWPGNLLELKNLVQRILLLGGAAEIEMTEVNRALGVVPASDTTMVLRHDLPLREARADFERQYLLRCLMDTQGNIGELARHVGMERTHLYRKLRSLGIDLEKVRE